MKKLNLNGNVLPADGWRACLPWMLLVLSLFSSPAAALETSNGHPIQVTQTDKRLERNHVALDIDRVDTFTGALRMVQEDVRLPGQGGLDIALTRTYAPNMTYTAGPYPFHGRSHNYDELGMGNGWSFAVAPRLILSGGGWQGFSDRLCTGGAWPKAGFVKHRGPYGERIFGIFSWDTNLPEYQPEVLNIVTSYQLQHVNGQSEPLVPTQVGEVRSNSGWKLTCSANRYTLHGPDGTKYEMNRPRPWEGSNIIYGQTMVLWGMLQATRIVDTNGNELKIEYIGDHYPSRVSSADGAIYLNLAYDVRPHSEWADYFLREVTDNGGRTWRYDMQEDPPLVRSMYDHQAFEQNNFTNKINYQLSMRLMKVMLPDGSEWKFDYWDRITGVHVAPCFRYSPMEGATLLSTTGNCERGASSGLMKTLHYPTGGSIGYEYQYSKPAMKGMWQWEWYYDQAVYEDLMTQLYSNIDRLSYSSLVKSRTLSTGETWRYDYSNLINGQFDRTTVTTPDTVETYTHIGLGKLYETWTNNNPDFPYPMSSGAWKLGLLVEKTIGTNYKETNEWTPVVLSSFWPDRSEPGLADMFQTFMPALQTRRIEMDGATYLLQNSNFDAFGKPGTVVESGPNGGSRTTSLTYLNNTAKWIVSRPQNATFAGGSTIRTFDDNGNLLSETIDGVATSYTYDARGNVVTRTMPRGLVYRYGEYKRGIPQTEAQPEGVTITREVDDNGNVAAETDGEGRTRRYEYDALNRVTAERYPVGHPKFTQYSPTSSTSTRGALVESIRYDPFGRVAASTIGNVTVTYAYDGAGRRVFESNPGASAGVSYEYDTQGRITRMVYPDGASETRTYGAGSMAATDTRGLTTLLTYRAYADPSKQLLMNVTAPLASASMAITRNTRDMVTSITQDGLTRTYGYNANNYLTSVTNPETGTTSYGRDIAGNMTSRTVGASGTTTFAYDGQNRLASVTYPGATPAVVNSYDKVGKIVASTSSGGNRSYVYTANGKIGSETLVVDGINLTASYTYDGNDNLSTITYPRSGQIVSYAPDVLGRPTQVSGYVSAIYYWPSGQLRQIEYANGTITAYGQNARLWPSTFATLKSGTGTYYSNASYGYDAIGNLTSISDTVDASYNRTMGYDPVNRLTQITGPWGAGTVAYSGTGNITRQALGAWNLNYSYANNRLSSISGSRSGSYQYDASGNIILGAGNSYTFDGASNLRCANCQSADSKVEYLYDAANHRSSVTKGGVKSYEMHTQSGMQLVEFTPGQNNKLIEYFYLGNKRVAQRVSP